MALEIKPGVQSTIVLPEATMSRVPEVSSRSRGEMSEVTANRLKDAFRVYHDGSRSQSKMSSKSRGSIEQIRSDKVLAADEIVFGRTSVVENREPLHEDHKDFRAKILEEEESAENDLRIVSKGTSSRTDTRTFIKTQFGSQHIREEPKTSEGFKLSEVGSSGTRAVEPPYLVKKATAAKG